MKSGTSPLIELMAAALDRGRLGHAMVLSAAEADAAFDADLGRLSRTLLCSGRSTAAQTLACGRCDSCLLLGSPEGGGFFTAAHPDAQFLRPENAVAGYNVDQIRALSQAFALRRALSPHRLAVLFDAELLATNGGAAANALLKLLEEPRPESFLILVTNHHDRLMQTIRSRCQVFRWRAAHEATDQRPGPGGTRPPGDPAHETLASWGDLKSWLEDGALAKKGQGLKLPPDEDSFWSEREKAVEEIDLVADSLWTGLRPAWASFDLEAGRRVLDFFVRFRELGAAVRANGNGALQWMSLRADARMGI